MNDLKILSVTANSMREVIISLISVNVTTMQKTHSHARELKIGWFNYSSDYLALTRALAQGLSSIWKKGYFEIYFFFTKLLNKSICALISRKVYVNFLNRSHTMRDPTYPKHMKLELQSHCNLTLTTDTQHTTHGPESHLNTHGIKLGISLDLALMVSHWDITDWWAPGCTLKWAGTMFIFAFKISASVGAVIELH